ncbi:MAG TPA: 2,3-bisphosphoglycerate-independent phosphoglycerate mutase [Candidatus Paceibacterota bacterium]|nr:2,3-bisphosphoglycerate-independent phosphoglycerate mutase [Candidatus Paceibacterota bacterium]
MTKKTTILIVLDGWGIGRSNESNPVYIVKPQIFDWLAANYPVTSLQASGIAVGLPWGEVGNSEVGHLTIGAGKVIYQYYPKITMAIRDGSFAANKALTDAFDHVLKNNAAINFAGLLSKGNVHASLEHILELVKLAEARGITNINLHLFADGKDSPPHTLQSFLREIPRQYWATLVGRYYAMDRNGNWRITETAYQLMTGQVGPVVEDPTATIEATYQQGSTEEYLPPMRFAEDKKIKDGDALVFFNYREDSIRQIASSFIMKPFDKFPTVPFENLYIATMTHYDNDFNVPVICEADEVTVPLGKVFSDLGYAQLRIAETYKYAHVTYFFNGLREPPFPGEYRTLIPSNSSLHPEEHPEMMASAITDRLIEAVKSKGFQFILVNYANADAIAHTADYNAALEAVRVIDREITRVVQAVDDPDILLVITSDHGNIEEMINPVTGLPESQHDASPVPFYLVAPEFKGRKFANGDNLAEESLGSLAEIAPTILKIIGIDKPPEMTGTSLVDQIL